MNPLTRLGKTLTALGPLPLIQNAVYQLLLKVGVYRNTNPIHKYSQENGAGNFSALPIPSRDSLLPYLKADMQGICAAEKLICENHFHPFGGQNLSQLDFNPVNGSRHWAASSRIPCGDLKLIWEPARFCWVDDLMRSEVLTQNRHAAACFWNLLQTFTQKNSPNAGENWESAQEVSLRMINIAFCASVLLRQPSKDSLNMTHARQEEKREECLSRLSQLIQAHVRRIPSTLIYARSQRNNHLLSEAAGLMTAGCVLPDSSDSEKWFADGWRFFCDGLNDQLAEDGCYIQQSTNYHRLMLQLVIWTDMLLRMKGQSWPDHLFCKIQRSIHWLYTHCDQLSGSVCNLGHNDGALLFSFGADFGDYRPTLQAASRIFLEKPLFPAGAWDELGLWLNVQKREPPQIQADLTYLDHSLLRIGDEYTWGLLRAAVFLGRPAHDDQTQVDLWFDGENVAMDAGTYRYSGKTYWNNRLKTAFLHNVLTIDNIEPMTDAGKFLWLDWDEARVLKQDEKCVSAEHFAPGRLNLKHVRTLEIIPDGFLVTDEVTSKKNPELKEHTFRLHWLLPDQDFDYQADGCLKLTRQKLVFKCDAAFRLRIVRKGECIFDSQSPMDLSPFEKSMEPWSGWISPTYDEKDAALSVILTVRSKVPFKIETIIQRSDPQRRFLF